MTFEKIKTTYFTGVANVQVSLGLKEFLECSTNLHPMQKPGKSWTNRSISNFPSWSNSILKLLDQVA